MSGPRSGPSILTRIQRWGALRHRNYRLFFGGQLVSLIGTWMQSVAQSWLVLQLTGDPFYLGLVAAAQFVPVLLLGLFGGLIADSLPKRRTLLATQVVAMLLAVILFGLTATDNVAVWHVLVLALGLGCTNAIDMPTRQAFSVEMVGRGDIGNAVALNSAMFNGARVVGPAVAGLTIGAFGISVAFLVNALSFLAVIGAVLLMRESELHPVRRMERPESPRAVMENLGEGLRYVRQTSTVLLAVAVIGLVSTFGMNFTVLIPPLAQDVLHSDASGFGFLMAATGLGSLVAALGIAVAGRTGPLVIGAGAFLMGLAEIVLGFSQLYPISLIAMFIAGVGGIAMAATANTVIQLTVPDQLRGRVLSVYTTVFAGSTPVGGLVMGSIASTFGPALAIAVGGLASALTGVGAMAWLRRLRRRPAAAIAPGMREGAEAATAALNRVGPR